MKFDGISAGPAGYGTQFTKNLSRASKVYHKFVITFAQVKELI